MVSEKEFTALDLNRTTLVTQYIFQLMKTNKPLLLQTESPFYFVSIMEAQDEAEIRMEGNPE
jgi:hypothetical protein